MFNDRVHSSITPKVPGVSVERYRNMDYNGSKCGSKTPPLFLSELKYMEVVLPIAKKISSCMVCTYSK